MRLAVVVLALLACARTARADDDDRAVQLGSWAAATTEVATAGYVALLATHHAPKQGSGAAFALNMTPALLGGVAALAAYHWDLDPTPALALHGAVWTGVDLMLLGILIDGRHHRDGLGFGKAAAILGVVGAAGGAVLGATVGDRAPEAWLLVPTVGLAAGLAGGGLWAMIAGPIGGDRMMPRITTGLVVGLTATIATVAVLGATTEPVAATPRRTMFSYGASF